MLGLIGRSSTALAAPAVEDDFLVLCRFLEAMFGLEFDVWKGQRVCEAGEWDGDGRRDGPLCDFIWLSDIDDIRVLSHKAR